MKVLQINTVMDYGSTGGIARGIYDVLVANGHDCTIAYGRGNSTDGYKSIKIGSANDNKYHYLKSFLFNKAGFASKRATHQFIETINTMHFDLVQIHNLHGYYINIKILFDYLAKKKIPVVILLHDQWLFSGGAASIEFNPDTYLSNPTSKNEYPKSVTRRNHVNILNKKIQIISKMNQDKFHIVTPSKWLGNIAKQTYLNKYRITIIHNGIDLDRFKPKESNLREEFGLKDKKIYLAVASEWEERKGIVTLCNFARYLDVTSKLVIVGQQTKPVEKNDRIIFINRTRSIEELVHWYSASDVLLNPTLFDNFPTVNIEALACGTPVITYETGGSPEAIEGDLNVGKVIPRGNEEAFIQAALQWQKKDQTIINNCLIRSKLYDMNLKYREYLTLYQSML